MKAMFPIQNGTALHEIKINIAWFLYLYSVNKFTTIPLRSFGSNQVDLGGIT